MFGAKRCAASFHNRSRGAYKAFSTKGDDSTRTDTMAGEIDHSPSKLTSGHESDEYNAAEGMQEAEVLEGRTESISMSKGKSRELPSLELDRFPFQENDFSEDDDEETRASKAMLRKYTGPEAELYLEWVRRKLATPGNEDWDPYEDENEEETEVPDGDPKNIYRPEGETMELPDDDADYGPDRFPPYPNDEARDEEDREPEVPKGDSESICSPKREKRELPSLDLDSFPFQENDFEENDDEETRRIKVGSLMYLGPEADLFTEWARLKLATPGNENWDPYADTNMEETEVPDGDPENIYRPEGEPMELPDDDADYGPDRFPPYPDDEAEDQGDRIGNSYVQDESKIEVPKGDNESICSPTGGKRRLPSLDLDRFPWQENDFDENDNEETRCTKALSRMYDGPEADLFTEWARRKLATPGNEDWDPYAEENMEETEVPDGDPENIYRPEGEPMKISKDDPDRFPPYPDDEAKEEGDYIGNSNVQDESKIKVPKGDNESSCSLKGGERELPSVHLDNFPFQEDDFEETDDEETRWTKATLRKYIGPEADLYTEWVRRKLATPGYEDWNPYADEDIEETEVPEGNPENIYRPEGEPMEISKDDPDRFPPYPGDQKRHAKDHPKKKK
ncbi:MAG: hypothetical protein M1812_003367 [Candelaria pacifica]|nr:MAG: hypothetical protein M1812_003367 [Candelaria pacifica]